MDAPFPMPQHRIGHGYDLHRLEPIAPGGAGKPLVLGGVAVASAVGPVAHSDGDALLHAVTDALLGAAGLPDIGQLFPDSEARWKDVDSARLLGEAVRLVRERGYGVGNLDCTLVLQRPKIAETKEAMRKRIAGLLGIDPRLVNLKGKTHEGVDAVGEGRAVEAHAVVLLVRRNGEDRG